MENKSNWIPNSNSVADNYKNLGEVPRPQSVTRNKKRTSAAADTPKNAPKTAMTHDASKAAETFRPVDAVEVGMMSDIDESNLLMSRVFPRLNAEYSLNTGRGALDAGPEPDMSAELPAVPAMLPSAPLSNPGSVPPTPEPVKNAPRFGPSTPMPRMSAAPDVPAMLPSAPLSDPGNAPIAPEPAKRAPRFGPSTPMPHISAEPAADSTPMPPATKNTPSTPVPSCYAKFFGEPDTRRETGAHNEPAAPELCFGEDSKKHAGTIRDFIYDELSDHKYYMELARKVRSKPAAILRRIGADEERHAKRLSTAYNLITGEAYFPTGQVFAPVILSPADGLRSRVREELAGAEKYKEAADAAKDDPCLSSLFKELAADEERHSREIQGLIGKQ